MQSEENSEATSLPCYREALVTVNPPTRESRCVLSFKLLLLECSIITLTILLTAGQAYILKERGFTGFRLRAKERREKQHIGSS